MAPLRRNVDIEIAKDDVETDTDTLDHGNRSAESLSAKIPVPNQV